MSTVHLRIRLTPRSGRNQIVRFAEGVLHVRVAAPPVDGAANTALLAFLAQEIGVRKSALSIVSGASSREKKIAIDGLTQAEMEALMIRFIAEESTMEAGPIQEGDRR
jgi:uncharacterized protein (TIGR00251 family)